MADSTSSRVRPAVILLLVLISLAAMGYFYVYLHGSTVFTHLFYVPIILAALWWGRRGIWVSVFLSLALVATHIWMKKYYNTPDDFFRALMFIVAASVVAVLSERFTRTRERMQHFNLVLRSIRDINHLITKEKDLDRLLKGICVKLVENRSYFYAWIAVVDEESRLVWVAESGLGDGFHSMTEMLVNGTMPLCVQRGAYRRGPIVTKDPRIECAGCPLSSQFADKGRMTVRLNPGGRLRGMLSVSIPEDLLADRDEQDLFREIADDIEYALGGIALRGEHEVTLEELKESEVRFRTIVENAPFGYYRLDSSGLIEYVNPEWARMLGFSGDDVIGRHIAVTQTGEESRQIGEQTGLVLAGATVRGEFGLRRKDGSLVFQTYYSQPLYHHGEIAGAEGFLSDITERKNAELALRRNRRMLSQIIEGSPIPTFVIDEHHVVTHWNRACEELTGVTSEQVVGTNRHWEPFYGEERPTMADMIMYGVQDPALAEKHVVDFRQSPLGGEAVEAERFFPGLGKHGKWIFLTAALLRDSESSIVGAIETLQDITGRKRAEEEKIRAYTELEQIFNSTPVGMRVIDRDFQTLHMNRRFMDMFDIDSRHFARGEQAAWDREIVRTDRILMRRIVKGDKYLEYEVRTRVRDEDVTFIVHASPYFSKDGSVVGVIENFTNITETRMLQNGIMRVAEIERQRIGQDLHDGLGQNLTAVTFLIEALKEKTSGGSGTALPDIENIEGLIRNAIVQTRNLSRMLSPVEMEKNGLRSALDEMAVATEKIYHVSCKVMQDGNFLIGDNQTATHLFYIAREAVTNSIKHGKADQIFIHLTDDEDGLMIVVRDNGAGAAELKNTGLGLRIMSYRAGIIGAEFSAGNREEGGFEVRVQLKA